MANFKHVAYDILEGFGLGSLGSILFAGSGIKGQIGNEILAEVIHGTATILFAFLGAIIVFYTNKYLRKKHGE